MSARLFQHRRRARPLTRAVPHRDVGEGRGVVAVGVLDDRAGAVVAAGVGVAERDDLARLDGGKEIQNKPVIVIITNFDVICRRNPDSVHVHAEAAPVPSIGVATNGPEPLVVVHGHLGAPRPDLRPCHLRPEARIGRTHGRIVGRLQVEFPDVVAVGVLEAVIVVVPEDGARGFWVVPEPEPAGSA